MGLRSMLLHLLALVLFHELAEVHSLTRPVKSSIASSTTSDWLVHLLIVEVTEALWGEAVSSAIVRTIHGRARAEWHHEALDMGLVDTVLLVQLLKKFVVFALLLNENNPLLVVSLSPLKMSDLLVLQLRLLVHLLDPVLQLLVLVHQELSVVSSLGIAIVINQFLKLINLNFEFLVVNGTVLKSSLILLE